MHFVPSVMTAGQRRPYQIHPAFFTEAPAGEVHSMRLPGHLSTRTTAGAILPATSPATHAVDDAAGAKTRYGPDGQWLQTSPNLPTHAMWRLIRPINYSTAATRDHAHFRLRPSRIFRLRTHSAGVASHRPHYHCSRFRHCPFWTLRSASGIAIKFASCRCLPANLRRIGHCICRHRLTRHCCRRSSAQPLRGDPRAV